MPSIELSDTELANLMFILANAEFKGGVTWAILNPILMKVGQQAQKQTAIKPTDSMQETGHVRQ